MYIPVFLIAASLVLSAVLIGAPRMTRRSARTAWVAGAGVALAGIAVIAIQILRWKWRRPGDSGGYSLPALRPVAVRGLAGIRLLVVDDDPDWRSVARRLLEDDHAQVVTAKSAREAFEVFQRERPDVIVSDIGMPEEDGYSFIRRVRQLPASMGGRTPALALTAFTTPNDRMRALDAGFEMHVAKPVEPRELLSAVAKLSAGYRAGSE